MPRINMEPRFFVFKSEIDSPLRATSQDRSNCEDNGAIRVSNIPSVR
jgi:hypothetical protein